MEFLPIIWTDKGNKAKLILPVTFFQGKKTHEVSNEETFQSEGF
jgi:hypothetical protein